jgi:hypothetical protein
MKATTKISLVLGLVLSIGSVSNAFCLKQYSRNMNRYTASFNNQAQHNNYAAATQVASAQTVQPVNKQK